MSSSSRSDARSGGGGVGVGVGVGGGGPAPPPPLPPSGRGNALDADGDDATASAAAAATTTRQPVRVFLRLRPMNKLEASRRSRNCVDVHEDRTTLTVDSPLEGEYDFHFDQVFDKDAPQNAVYDQVGHPMASSFVEGKNCCIFAYGQTGTGKTHTMMGVGGGDDMTAAAANMAGGGAGGVGAGAGADAAGTGGVGGESSSGAAAGEQDGGGGGSPPPPSQTQKKAGGEGGGEPDDEVSGIIPRIIRDVFRLLKESPPDREYTIRCSYVELYLEKVWDLLDPTTSRELSIADCSGLGLDGDGEEGVGGGVGGGERMINIINASEACCVDESDVISLLVRGNACRSVSATRMNTDSSRSHALFLLHLDRTDDRTGDTARSTLALFDLAGSEYGGKPQSRQSAQGQNLAEAKMIHRGLSALNQVVRAVGHGAPAAPPDGDHYSLASDASPSLSPSPSTRRSAPYRNSKLTRLLRQPLGGNCVTSIVVTASGSSYNVHETLNTIRFGQRARRIVNSVSPNELRSARHYRRIAELERAKRAESMFLLRRVHDEWTDKRDDPDSPQMAGEQSKSNDTWEHFDGGGGELWRRRPGGAPRFTYASNLWESIAHLVKEDKCDAESVADRSAAVDASDKDGDDKTAERSSRTAEEEIAALKKELAIVTEQRNQAENAVAEIQSDVAVLRNQNRHSEQEKKKQQEDMIAAKKETQLLVQKTSELEHKLRTSMFRESEATVFLRQFRRFYRRLLRHKAAQGNGEVPDLISKVPGVPDLTDLIDVDTLLFDSGLIEESELYDDSSVMSFRPSQQALKLSQKAAKKSSRVPQSVGATSEDADGKVYAKESKGENEDGDNGNVDAAAEEKAVVEDGLNQSSTAKESGKLERPSDTGSVASSMTASSITQSIRGPSSGMREQTLQKELNTVTEKCIELQIALNEEKAKVDVLTNKAGSLNRKRLAQEALSLREALDKKTHDLQAIIWKMNELHLINKTYSEKMANRDQHVTYLEDTLRELQNQNRKNVSDKHDSEAKLRQELDNLQVLVDAMTIPLWQFGECVMTGRSLANRIHLPIRGDGQDPQQKTQSLSQSSLKGHESTWSGTSFASGTQDEEHGSRDECLPGQDATKLKEKGSGSVEGGETFGAGAKMPPSPGSVVREDEDRTKDSGDAKSNLSAGKPAPPPGAKRSMNGYAGQESAGLVSDIAAMSVISDTSSAERSLKKSIHSGKNERKKSIASSATGKVGNARRSSASPHSSAAGNEERVPKKGPRSIEREHHGSGLNDAEGRPMDLAQALDDKISMEGMELTIPVDGTDDVVSVVTGTSNFNEQTFVGGKSSTYVPRRFAPKKGLNIRAGIVKDPKKKFGKGTLPTHKER